MSCVTLGRTGLVLEKNGFGALPIQRISEADAVYLLRKAYRAGFRFFDTARYYTDSERKIRAAFAGMREKIVLASKTMALDAAGFRRDLETSLQELGTDYIDIYQFHNPPFCPRPGDGTGLYEEMLKALWGYMSDKLNIPVSSLTKENIREELQRKGCPNDVAKLYTDIISRCDEAQYSPIESVQMNRVYEEGVGIISRIESIIKR